MIRLMLIWPGLVSARYQSKLLPPSAVPMAPLAELGTSKNSSILCQPAPVQPPISVVRWVWLVLGADGGATEAAV